MILAGCGAGRVVRGAKKARLTAVRPRCARAIAVRIARNVYENGAPERIRTADPQIRSLGLRLGRTFLYRFFGLVEARRDLTDFLNQRDRDYCIGMISSRW